MATKNEKPKRKRYTTPKGEALFAHVVHVDYGTEQYPDAKGSFKIALALTADEAEKFRELLAEEMDAARVFASEKFSELKPASRAKLGEVKFNDLGVDEYDENENLTGRVLFRFKTGAFYENRQGVKVQRVIPLFDSMMQPVTLKDEPGNGSLVRISFTAAPYFVEGQGMGGLTMYLDAVQIIKLNKRGVRSAAEYGFGEEDGGFCAADDASDNGGDEDETRNGGETSNAAVSADDLQF